MKNKLFLELKTKPTGLSEREAEKRIKIYGYNELPKEKPTTAFSIFLRQFKNPLIAILLMALGITALFKDIKDFTVILLAIVINTILGFIQEYRSNNSLQALKKFFSPKATVTREGILKEINQRELVPGDVVTISPGSKIPADIKLFESHNLTVNEAILTGESKHIEKGVGDIVFLGTDAVAGKGTGVIVKIGINTEMGKIAEFVIKGKDPLTPLQKKLNSLGKNIALLVILLSAIIFVLGISMGKNSVDMLKTTVALAVAAVPEGLVVSLTVILSIGMQKIFKNNALVKSLYAAETLGSVDVICTDKTGTLTEGEMRVVKENFLDYENSIKCMVLCNDLANQTETALWEKVRSIDHLDPQQTFEQNKRLTEISFNSERKYMAVLCEKENNKTIYVKGAPEILLEWCKISLSEKKELTNVINKWSGDGLRLLALISKNIPNKETLHTNIEFGFSFLGILGLTDPVREGIAPVLKECQKAGIKVVVVTGDHTNTAIAVLESLGIKIGPEEIMDGKELSDIEESDLLERAPKTKLFSRVSPSHKLKIVKAFQSLGSVVAMTGDGVNDAPALKTADIGIVVGTASEVSRETADMVLLDSNFKTIVSAVAEGRAIFDNIRKVALYLLSDSFGEISLISLAIIFKFPLPLLAGQLLWINLIADGLPGLALTNDPKTGNILRRKPHEFSKQILNGEMLSLIAVISLIAGLASFGLFILFYKNANIELARTITFASLGVDSLLYVFSCRDLERPFFGFKSLSSNIGLLIAVFIGFILQVSVIYIPILQSTFNTVPLKIYHWGIVLIFGFLVIMGIEITKKIFSHSKRMLI